MKATCIICGEFFSNVVDVCALQCGHVFHSACVFQWLERKSDCPHCRKKTTEKKVIKLYLDYPSDSSVVDPVDLEHQLDNLKFQILCKDQELKTLKTESEESKKHKEGLRSEVKTLRKSLGEKETFISGLQSEISVLISTKKEADRAKSETRAAQTELRNLQMIKNLIEESSQDIEEAMNSYTYLSDPQESLRQLVTFVCLLKRQIKTLREEKKKIKGEFETLKFKAKEMKRELHANKAEIDHLNASNTNLKEDNEALEKENKSQAKKISSLEATILSPSEDTKNHLIHRLLRESPAPSVLKRSSETTEIPDFIDLTPEVIRKKPKHLKENESKSESSPYLQIKSSSMNPLVNRNKNPSSICPDSENKNLLSDFLKTKNASFNSSKEKPVSCIGEMGYDGFGGHSRVDDFPKPNPFARKPLKKKSSLIAGKNPTIKIVNGRKNDSQPTASSFDSVLKYFTNTFDD